MIPSTGKIPFMYSVKVDSRRARNRIRKLIQRIDTLPWREAGEIVKLSVKVNFVLGGSPKKWTPRKVDVPWPILRKTDKLMNSIYVNKLRNGVAVGSRKPYQAVHNFGFPPRNIPARKYLFAKKEDIVNINKLFKKHLRMSRQ